MSFKRSRDESADTDLFATVPKRKMDDIQLLSPSSDSQPLHDRPSPSTATTSLSSATSNDHTFDTHSPATSSSSYRSQIVTDQLINNKYVHNCMATTAAAMTVDHDISCSSSSLMDCSDDSTPIGDNTSATCNDHSRRRTATDKRASTASAAVDEDDDDEDCDTDPDIIIPYLKRFQESYQTSLGIYTSRLEKLELSDALKCTNDLFAVAIDNYQKEHNGFAHKTTVDLSGVHNVRREFDELLDGAVTCNTGAQHRPSTASANARNTTTVVTNFSADNGYANSGDISGQRAGSNSFRNTSNVFTNELPNNSQQSNECHNIYGHYNPEDNYDDKLTKVIQFMCQIEAKICYDMKQIYCSYERLLEALVMIEYRLAIIIEMFHHMTDVEPQKFLPCLPFIQNVPDLMGYINSLHDANNELPIKDESTNERMQAIVDQFRAMHKRIRDAMDGLHALSCIIMEKKTEVIDRVHTFYKKAEQIFFSQPPFVFHTKDHTNRCL